MQSPDKVRVTLTPDMARDVRDAVANGEFASTSDVVQDAIRVWQRQRFEDAERIAAIRMRVRRSLDDPRPDLDEDEVERHFADLHAQTVKTHRDAKA